MYNNVKCPVRTLRNSSGSLETSIVRLCAVLGISLFFSFDSCHLTRSEVGREKEINANFTRKFLLPVLFTPPPPVRKIVPIFFCWFICRLLAREKKWRCHMLSPTFVRSPSLKFLFFPSFAERKKFVQKKSGTAPSQKLYHRGGVGF